MTRSQTFWAGIFGVVLFVVTCALGGWHIEGYRHVAQYISETYAAGTPHGRWLCFLGFIPAGLLLTAFAWQARRLVPATLPASAGFIALGLFYGLGTVVCSLFPCDPGCGRLSSDNASASQLIHNLAGLLTYLTVPATLITLGVTARKWPGGKTVARAGLICGVVAAIGAVLFLGNPQSPVAGLVQRITEAAILTWIVICAFYLRRAEHSAANTP